MKKHVVILGGGYAGVRALRILAKQKKFRITLIDQNPYHYLQTEVYDFIAGKSDMSDIMIDLRSLCNGFENNVVFVNSLMRSIDFGAKRVVTEQEEVGYDYLLLATGAQTYFPSFIEGLAAHSNGVKSAQRALQFKQHFEKELFNRIKEEGAECPLQSFNIIIGGAGLSGVEIAAEMAYYAKTFYKRGSFGCKGINVILIDALEDILFGMDPFLIKIARKRLEALGVTIMHNRRISSVQEEQATLDGGEVLDFDFMIFTGGIVASDSVRDLPIPKNRKNHLAVTPYLTLEAHPDVFAVGDVAQVADRNGKLLPPTAQVAEKSAELAVENIIRSVEGKALHKADIRMQGIMVALGGYYAAGILPGNVRINGYLAYLVKKAIHAFYKRPLHKIARIGYDRLHR
jgi:NADH dehydrogenase